MLYRRPSGYEPDELPDHSSRQVVQACFEHTPHDPHYPKVVRFD